MSATATRSDRARLEKLRNMVHEVTGIRLPASKDLMIETRLGKRLAALRLPDLSAYLAHLFEGGAMAEELPAIVDLLTTNKTDFFREPGHYDLLGDRLIPEALERAQPGRPVRFRVWSAAASTGAEAWSAAMVLADAATRDPRLHWSILGTDISRRVLATARRAVYPLTEFSPVPAGMRAAYVMAGHGASEGRGRIVPELRARVQFAGLNLMRTPYAVDRGLDVAFLRNVLIYFEPDVQHRVAAGIAAHLRPGGHLIVGHSEAMSVQVPGLSTVGAGVFRKDGGR